MQNRLEKPLNVKNTTSASVSTPGAGSISIFSEGDTLKQKHSNGEVSQLVGSNPGATGGSKIANMIEVTQAEYDAIGTPDALTLYIING